MSTDTETRPLISNKAKADTKTAIRLAEGWRGMRALEECLYAIEVLDARNKTLQNRVDHLENQLNKLNSRMYASCPHSRVTFGVGDDCE